MPDEQMTRESAKLLVTIVDRGKGERVAEVCQSRHVSIQLICLGTGTVRSEKLSYWGLGDPEKDLFISIIPASLTEPILNDLNQKLQFSKPGSGIAFTLQMTSVSALVARLVEDPALHIQTEGEKNKMEEKTVERYEMVVALVRRGASDLVMTAARAAGASGGTVVRARGLGSGEVEKFLSITIETEKEIVMIITPKEKKQTIMQEICRQCTAEIGERAMVFSLPVDNVTGLTPVIQPEAESALESEE